MTEPARFPLASLPTPLVRAARLERALGAPPLWVKRDDLTGFGLAGNKARKLELLVADALAQNAGALVSGGGAASNHCVATAAAARVAGLDCHLVLYGSGSGGEHPNLALARELGARVRFTGDPERASVDVALARAAEQLEDRGVRPYLVPRGGATALGAAAYALAARELAEQLERAEVLAPVVVVAAGSCGTFAGLVAGDALGGYGWRVVGASVSRPPDECRTRARRLARAACRVLGRETEVTAVEVVDARGPGYGDRSEEGAAAADLALATEGLLLDPTFTAKALGAAVALVAGGVTRPLVFVHTGGMVSALWEVLRARGRDALV